MLCIAVFVTATLAVLLILSIVVAADARHFRTSVRSTPRPKIFHGDNEMWESPDLYIQDVQMFDIQTAETSLEHHGIPCD